MSKDKTSEGSISGVDKTLRIHLKFLDRMPQEHNRTLSSMDETMIMMEVHLW